MQKILSILGIVNKIFITIVLLFTVFLTFTLAYIIFAPNDLPKPFYLQYILPEQVAGVEQTAGEGATPAEGETPAPAAEVKPGEGIMIDTGAKIINLAEPGGRKYIRLSVVLEFAPGAANYTEMNAEEKSAYVTEFTAEINAKLAVINDVIISMFSTKTFEELYTAEGKETARNEVLQHINERMPDYKVLSVYFTEFVIE